MQPLACPSEGGWPGARRTGLPVSILLHALTLALLGVLLRPEALLAPTEGIPVEFWTPSQWEGLTDKAGGPEDPSPPQATPDAATLPPSEHPPVAGAAPAPPPAGQASPDRAGMIRAEHLLSAAVLSDPRSRKMREALRRFDAATRREQLCDIEARAQVAAAFKALHPDRVVAYALADVKVSQNTLFARGAAFRSGKGWYGLTFTCDLSPDGRAVTSFVFAVGQAIPKEDWEEHGLPDPAIDTDF